ncbi:MAG: polysaccharide deacetylase, partial [Bacteroidetes bacterium]|nr:polysaccharide deacetylase [Bacteroidota bacterium]
MAKEHFILLSFDVEEFDMPLEYNQVINLSEQLKVGNDGMQKILPVINSQNTPCTLFTTATYAIHFPQQIKELSN